ncbi:adenylate cyclase, terminal-differentiation specific-like [Macrobrachium nipponense]|uniref:adenylate cyclase, terminal-differentiation specific-like n=1 Tax=Macrobrachium nipponense TaxID=159736 RepID=UPI0030C7C7B4
MIHNADMTVHGSYFIPHDWTGMTSTEETLAGGSPEEPPKEAEENELQELPRKDQTQAQGQQQEEQQEQPQQEEQPQSPGPEQPQQQDREQKQLDQEKQQKDQEQKQPDQELKQQDQEKQQQGQEQEQQDQEKQQQDQEQKQQDQEKQKAEQQDQEQKQPDQEKQQQDQEQKQPDQEKQQQDQEQKQPDQEKQQQQEQKQQDQDKKQPDQPAKQQDQEKKKEQEKKKTPETQQQEKKQQPHQDQQQKQEQQPQQKVQQQQQQQQQQLEGETNVAKAPPRKNRNGPFIPPTVEALGGISQMVVKSIHCNSQKGGKYQVLGENKSVLFQVRRDWEPNEYKCFKFLKRVPLLACCNRNTQPMKFFLRDLMMQDALVTEVNFESQMCCFNSWTAEVTLRPDIKMGSITNDGSSWRRLVLTNPAGDRLLTVQKEQRCCDKPNYTVGSISQDKTLSV